MTEIVREQRNTVAVSGFANPINLECNVEDETHVSVYGDDELLDLGPDYSVEGAGDFGNLDEIDGVNIIIDADVLLEGFTTITVEHTPPLDQDADLSTGGTLGRVYMAALDAIMRRVQALGMAVGRRIMLPVDLDADPVLPLPEPRRALIWNDTGTALVNSFTDPDTDQVAQAYETLNDALAAIAASVGEAEAAQAAAVAAQSAAEAAQAAAEAAAAAAGDPEAIAAMGVPVGATMLFTHTSYPVSAFLKENGAVVSQAAYPALYAAIGASYNTGGEGGGNFRLPESRGEFIRVWDDGRGVDSGRSLYAAQAEMIGPHAHTATVASAGSHTHTVSTTAQKRYGIYGVDATDFGASDASRGPASRTYDVATSGAHSHTVTIDNNTGTENRPRNVARLAAIKFAVYEPPP